MRLYVLELFKRLTIAPPPQSLYVEAKHGVFNTVDSNMSSSVTVDAACRAEGVIHCTIIESIAGELRLASGWCQELEVFLIWCCRQESGRHAMSAVTSREDDRGAVCGGLGEAEADFVGGEAAVAAAVVEGKLFARHYYSN
jgi:hypothetical protein